MQETVDAIVYAVSELQEALSMLHEPPTHDSTDGLPTALKQLRPGDRRKVNGCLTNAKTSIIEALKGVK